MKYRRNRIATSVAILAGIVSACAGASAQVSTGAEIAVTNSGSPQGTRLIRFGVNPAATPGIDVELGEEAFPPFPPTASFEARFVTHGTGELGEGSPADIRPFTSGTQKDEYKIKFQPGTNGLPVTLTWDKDYLKDHYAAVSIKDPFGGIILTADMLAVATIQVSNANLTELIIEAEGPKTPGAGVDDEAVAARRMGLLNTPNPVDGATTVSYTLAKPAEVTLTIVDGNGATVASIVENGSREAGAHEEKIDATGLVAGVYFISLEAEGVVATKPMVVVR